MNDPEQSAAPSASGAARPSPVRAVLSFLARHPIGVLQTLFVALVAVVVLQNLEPTSIDLLFWSVPQLPKLALLLAAMAAGGLVWEIVRRLVFR
jgi:uncharacterized integral membrane protein